MPISVVRFSKLPKKVQNKIPISLKSMSDTYDLSELPPKLQELVREYLNVDVPVEYRKAFDNKPLISKYSDLYVTETAKETVVEYLKNYLYTVPGSYPFDPTFGCRLKYHLQTKDTQLRRLLVTDEINNVVSAMSSDLEMPIVVNSINIVPAANGAATTMHCFIDISIPGEEHVRISMVSFDNYTY